jgi:hypothetical protein
LDGEVILAPTLLTLFQKPVRFSPALFASLALLVWVAPVAAQQEIDAARQNARIRLGVVYATPTLQLKEFGVDSNVFNRSGAQSPDFTATVTPGASLALPVARRALVTSRVETNFVYYRRFANQRSISPSITLRGAVFMNRLTLFTDGRYLNTRERLNQEIDARARRRQTGLNAGFDLRVTPKVTLTTSVGVDRVDFDNDQVFRSIDLRTALAADSRSLSVSASHRATPLTTFRIQAEASEDRYRFTPLKNVNQRRVMAGVEFRPLALISGRADVGVRRFEPRDRSLPEFTGLSTAVSLRYTFRSATSFTVNLDRDTKVSYQITHPYYLATTTGLLVRRQLVGSFDMTGGIQRYNSAYRAVRGAVTTEERRVDVTVNYSADVGYRLGRNARVGVGVSYWSRESNQASDVAYSGFRVGSTLNYGL